MALSDLHRALRPFVSSWDRNPIAANAFRTMLAVGLSWLVALNLPGDAREYAYYAPLGAVIATTNNPGGSLRTALQAAAAIVLGGAVAFVAGLFLDPTSFVALAVTVGLTVLMASWRWLGLMGSWVPTAALFSLIFGDGEAPFVGYYTLLVLLGAAVAVLIAVVLPGQPLTLAERDLDRLRRALAIRVQETVERLASQGAEGSGDEGEERDSARTAEGDGPHETRGAATTGGTSRESTREEGRRTAEEVGRGAHDPVEGRRPDLDQELARARQSVAELRDARRKNQRTHQHGATVVRAEDQLRTWDFAASALELVTVGSKRRTPDMPDRVKEATTEALAALKELLEGWHLTQIELDLGRLRAATERLDEAVNDPTTPASPTATTVLLTMSQTLDMVTERERQEE